MESFLKVSAASAFLITIVVVPITLLTLFFLFLLQERPDDKKKESAITLISYERDGKRIVPVTEETLVCTESKNLCQEVKRVISGVKECPPDNKSLRFSGYFQGSLQGEVYASCSEYEELIDILQETRKEQASLL